LVAVALVRIAIVPMLLALRTVDGELRAAELGKKDEVKVAPDDAALSTDKRLLLFAGTGSQNGGAYARGHRDAVGGAQR
jgi:hypothetical protein